jgi:exodeoxyribonuclease III
MRLLTWNINSVRLRLPLLLRLIHEVSPDVICLQETKCPDEAFPLADLQAAGYHAHINGMKSYNGVAILSRAKIEASHIHPRVGRNDCRHISAVIQGHHVHCLYIPAGGDIPDPDQNEKFAHKLSFVDELGPALKNIHGKEDKVILAGDFNIAPYEHDVWSHKQLLDVVSHTPIEVAKLGQLQASRDWVDTARHFVPMDQKSYSWWSYRSPDWKRGNRGRRLDHIWVSPNLAPKLAGYAVLVDARDWPQPSDHVPVIMDMKK